MKQAAEDHMCRRLQRVANFLSCRQCQRTAPVLPVHIRVHRQIVWKVPWLHMTGQLLTAFLEASSSFLACALDLAPSPASRCHKEVTTRMDRTCIWHEH